jgi:hypothetical protein
MIFDFAAPLYRLALTAFLPLTYDRPMPPASEPKTLSAYIAERMEFMDPQEHAEEAILTATQPPAPSLARRSGATRPAATH